MEKKNESEGVVKLTIPFQHHLAIAYLPIIGILREFQ